MPNLVEIASMTGARQLDQLYPLISFSEFHCQPIASGSNSYDLHVRRRVLCQGSFFCSINFSTWNLEVEISPKRSFLAPEFSIYGGVDISRELLDGPPIHNVNPEIEQRRHLRSGDLVGTGNAFPPLQTNWKR
jgi:hypothetical protein